MSPRAARTLVYLWLLLFFTCFAAAGTYAALAQRRDAIATTRPTAANTAAFVSDGRTRYAPGDVIRHCRKVRGTVSVLMPTMLATGIVAGLLLKRSRGAARR